MVLFVFSAGLMMMEVAHCIRRMSLDKINSGKGRMRLWKRLMVANILTTSVQSIDLAIQILYNTIKRYADVKPG